MGRGSAEQQSSGPVATRTRSVPGVAPEVVDRLLGLTRELGVKEVDLDEHVYDCVGNHRADAYNAAEGPADDEQALETLAGEAEDLASKINNGGLEEQLRFLARELGEERVTGLLRVA